ncbi:hypothetical protein ESZ47_01660 [Leuconostoc litchii]|uniref:Distal tail protein N-terminal domain-containing protein n=2 Tax=Leuconostoc litchii TaxID=1981069 RepID=A0A6P2CRI6_9LACO|nr:hypothetical protein ESZ47_01660 [Leuconostoc litchii]
MFTLQNSRGEVVDLDSDDLFGYTPTGLGAVFSNSYSQYDSYFNPTKTTIQQGQMSLNILFGSVESQSYQTFSDFSRFLAYQPLTLIYTTKSGGWYRDAVLSSLTKTEIGGTTVIQVDRLVEQFTIDFINPWYNNKTAEYKSYDADPNLITYGKGYFNYINPATSSPNLLLGSQKFSFSGNIGPNAATPSIENYDSNTKMLHIIAPQGSGAYAGIFMGNELLKANNIYSFSFDIKGTGIPSNFFGWGDYSSDRVQKGSISADWSRMSISGTVTKDNSTILLYFNTDSQPLDVYLKLWKIESGNVPTDWTPAVSESKATWNYGYFGNGDSSGYKNEPYADFAKADITYIEN